MSASAPFNSELAARVAELIAAGDLVIELKVGRYSYPVTKQGALLFLASHDLLTAAKELGVVCDSILVEYSEAEEARLRAAWAKLDAAVALAEGRGS